MKISSINPTFLNFNNVKRGSTAENPPISENTKNSTPSISFMAATITQQGFKRPNIKNEELKKIFLLAKKIPNNCEMKEVSFINLNNERFAYKIKKDGTGRTEVGIKNKVESIKEWISQKNDQQSMECTFDPKGMLVSAEIKNTKEKPKITFEHTGREGRRINMDDRIYRPIIGETNIWGVIPDKFSRNIIGEENLAVRLENNIFGSTLLELGGNRASIALLRKE